MVTGGLIENHPLDILCVAEINLGTASSASSDKLGVLPSIAAPQVAGCLAGYAQCFVLKFNHA
eukprot:scaffold408971_cov19-Prasinocladus_malaysianus.AAC.1